MENSEALGAGDALSCVERHARDACRESDALAYFTGALNISRLLGVFASGGYPRVPMEAVA